MPLILETGQSSVAGRLDTNSDACLICNPDPHPHAQPALIAIADTLDQRDEQEVAQYALDQLKQNFYTAPVSWSSKRILKESFGAANIALSGDSQHHGATTLTALTLYKHQWTIGHVGDSRVWLLRDQRIRQLTRDHTLQSMEMGSVVTHACGLNSQLDVQVLAGEIREEDVFLLTTDGVHDALGGTVLMANLMKDISAKEIASSITDAAIAAGSKDNVSAIVVKVERLPSLDATSGVDSISALPVAQLPKKGDTIDGYQIRGLIHRGRMACIYKAYDQKKKQNVALRFPIPKLAEEIAYIDAFLREEWIGRRLDNQHLVKAIEVNPKRRTVLYSVLQYNRGENLSKRILRKGYLQVKEALFLIEQLLECVDYLHSQGVTHRDIKPANILIDKRKRRLMLIGFGLSSIEQLQDQGADTKHYRGTKSYMAPELLVGDNSDRRTDIYSIGVCLYRMLTGNYPYGKITSGPETSFSNYTPAGFYNSEIPDWLEEVLAKACAVNSSERFHNADAFVRALQDRPETSPQSNIAVSNAADSAPWWHWAVPLGIAVLFTLLIALILG